MVAYGAGSTELGLEGGVENSAVELSSEAELEQRLTTFSFGGKGTPQTSCGKVACLKPTSALVRLNIFVVDSCIQEHKQTCAAEESYSRRVPRFLSLREALRFESSVGGGRATTFWARQKVRSSRDTSNPAPEAPDPSPARHAISPRRCHSVA